MVELVKRWWRVENCVQRSNEGRGRALFNFDGHVDDRSKKSMVVRERIKRKQLWVLGGFAANGNPSTLQRCGKTAVMSPI